MWECDLQKGSNAYRVVWSASGDRDLSEVNRTGCHDAAGWNSRRVRSSANRGHFSASAAGVCGRRNKRESAAWSSCGLPDQNGYLKAIAWTEYGALQSLCVRLVPCDEKEIGVELICRSILNLVKRTLRITESRIRERDGNLRIGRRSRVDDDDRILR